MHLQMQNFEYLNSEYFKKNYFETLIMSEVRWALKFVGAFWDNLKSWA